MPRDTPGQVIRGDGSTHEASDAPEAVQAAPFPSPYSKSACVFGRDSAHSLKNGAVTQSYRIQHHIPARPCLRLAETLQGTSEAFVLPKTPARR